MLTAITFTSCYYDNEQDLYPQSQLCDTSAVTYSGTIVPMLQQHCLKCHNNTNAPALGGNIRLENYVQVKNAVVNGSFAGSIIHSNQYKPMPPDYRLSQCLILKTQWWIAHGSPQN